MGGSLFVTEHKMKMLNTKKLADMLGTTPKTINTMRWQIRRGIIDACRLPPAIELPGARPIYADVDVQRWLDEVRGGASKPIAKLPEERHKAGRPRKSDIPAIRLR